MSHLKFLRARLRPDRGAITAVAGIALVPVLMVGAVVVDGGRVYVERQRVQAAAEAGALAGAARWADGQAPCAQVVTEVATANTENGEVTCASSGTSASGTVDVEVTAPVSTFFAGLLQRDSTPVSSSASVSLGAATGVSGLRPIALCSASPAVAAWRASGFTSSQVFRVALGADEGTCSTGIPGNWAVIDFDAGSNSNAKTQDWIDNGYPGVVSAPSDLFGDPGIPSPSLNIDSLIGETVFVPLYANARFEGANAKYTVVSFASVTIVDSRLSGSASGRYIDLVFRQSVAPGPCCDPGVVASGVSALSVCSLDDVGVCPE
jgi:Flp pilus assembly protein TadG